ncbi:MAG TPA: tRNA pseudouridine(55) synthase TruB [Feifaniaceae bacterium]|nr:tRNA pseudouridine(55) synthase TruB [Feifaniaceae bacterium]
MTEGIVNILKPPGMTSSNVVSDVRRLFELKRVGHTGTLDPGAAGVLPVCLGRATRLFDYLVNKEKEYIAEISFGARTDTQDSYGRVVETSSRVVEEAELRAALPSFLGEQTQIAPRYSALKSGGKAMYELARSGREVPERVRPVTIHALELIDQTRENRFLIRIGCSRGTYIRTLCEDIGKRLFACAHMSFLLRTASGTFRVEDAHSIEELSGQKERGTLLESVIPIPDALSFLPRVAVGGDKALFRLKNGLAEPIPDGARFAENQSCLVYGGGELIGVGEWTLNGLKLKLHLGA